MLVELLLGYGLAGYACVGSIGCVYQIEQLACLLTLFLYPMLCLSISLSLFSPHPQKSQRLVEVGLLNIYARRVISLRCLHR